MISSGIPHFAGVLSRGDCQSKETKYLNAIYVISPLFHGGEKATAFIHFHWHSKIEAKRVPLRFAPSSLPTRRCI